MPVAYSSSSIAASRRASASAAARPIPLRVPGRAVPAPRPAAQHRRRSAPVAAGRGALGSGRRPSGRYRSSPGAPRGGRTSGWRPAGRRPSRPPGAGRPARRGTHAPSRDRATPVGAAVRQEAEELGDMTPVFDDRAAGRVTGLEVRKEALQRAGGVGGGAEVSHAPRRRWRAPDPHPRSCSGAASARRRPARGAGATASAATAVGSGRVQVAYSQSG